MSTKTIAVDSQVYRRLAAEKREGESFSRVIGRLLDQTESAHTGRDILRRLEALPELAAADAGVMLAVVAENRDAETWPRRDLP